MKYAKPLRALAVLAGAAVLLSACGGGSSSTDATAQAAPARQAAQAAKAAPEAVGSVPPVVFVSRQIKGGGSIYLASAKDAPGVGPHSRFDAANPGKLIIRQSDGTQRVLVDGSTPTAASLQLVDVNAPDVSYDGSKIVFAGLAKRYVGNAYGSEGYAGGWRIYTINVDGSGLIQITNDEAGRQNRFTNRNLPQGLFPIDDGDPAWLPNGYIVFSSTRYPQFAQYGDVRATNLYTVLPDGTDLRRITSERNGADRPMVDPDTGKIVFARWWRNYRFPSNSPDTIADPNGGYIQKDGLTADRNATTPVVADMDRNSWHAATINPNGSQLTKWEGVLRLEENNQYYGGSFLANNQLLGNFFPMLNMVDAGGFGGIRHFKRGAAGYSPVIGVTTMTSDPNMYVAPGSVGVYKLGPGGMADWYASDPAVLPDGRVVVSLADSIGQDYGLYLMNDDGSNVQPLLDLAGTAELRAKPVVARSLPAQIRPPHSGTILALVPPLPEGPYDESGIYTFDSRNVFFNAPVDVDIVSAPPIGSVNTIRFFIDHQRQSPGSYANLDWPINTLESPISPQGRIRERNAPAGVSLFEQLRSPTGTVPATGGPTPNGFAHVAGMNYGVRNIVNKCVGCHAGHTLIDVPVARDDYEYTNLAPGATLTVSSTRDAATNGGLIDRRQMNGSIQDYWTSTPGQTAGEWVRLQFLVPIRVRTVRLYNPRFVRNRSDLQVTQATVSLCSDANCKTVLGSLGASNLAETGTDVAFPDVKARAVMVRIDGVTGQWQGLNVAGLGEIEVIARGEAP